MADAPLPAVLILEDDAGIAHLESQRLRRAGYHPVVAETPEKARELIQTCPIRVMLLDYRLKGDASGLDFYSVLRDEGLAVPSILVTGFSDEGVLAQAIRVGIRDFLPKTPDYLEYLVPTVTRVMAQVETERALEAERSRRVEEQAARAAAEAASRRKDEFLAMLAHELRNPIAAVANAAQLYRLGARSPEDLDWASDVIGRQVRHLSRLLEDLLDVSRIAMGKIQLRKEPLDARTVVQRAVEATRPLVESRRHNIACRLDPDPLPIEADATRFEQILVNLLTNAAKYTEPGGCIEVDALHDGDDVVVRVRDTGIGIAPEMLSRVFELFAQVDESLDRSQGGLGIGLTLVRKLTQMHSGDVTVRSDGPGKGSEFEVRIPARRTPACVAPAAQAPEVAPSAGRRILVVDDNSDTLEGIARYLTSLGHDVRTSHDGPDALREAKAFVPEVVLLDIGLPGMNGYQVAQALRAGGASAARLIAVSGYGQEDDRRRSRDAGFDHHLVKPVNFDALLAQLDVRDRQPIAAGSPGESSR